MSDELLQAAHVYAAAGLSVLPGSRESKAPVGYLLPQNAEGRNTWDPLRERIADVATIRRWFADGNVDAVALICGAVSGNLEVIDHDAPELFSSWCDLVDNLAPGLLPQLSIVQTQGGGYHVYYRCEVIEGNLKLARRAGDHKTLIETRGEGGYVLTWPTEGYVLRRGDLARIPAIEPEERAILLNAARTFNEVVKDAPEPWPAAVSSGDGRPGDDFNRRGDVLPILEVNGWVRVRQAGDVVYLRRPGKDRGISATWNHVPRRFYVFSTNAHPFEDGTAYSPFAVCALLEHDGDFVAAAKALAAQGYGDDGQLIGHQEPSLQAEEVDPDSLDTLEVLMSADELVGDDLLATWIDHYLIFASRMVSAPDSFHLTVGLSLLSIVVGRKVGVELRHGQIFPNLWDLLIAPSTVYHKTGAIRRGQRMLEQIDVDLVYPDDVTPEAMVSDVMTVRPAGIVLRDEFAGWLLGARRDYKSDIKDLYMCLYDCPPTYKRTLRLTGTVTIDKPYLCLTSAAVPVRFYNAVREDDWTNGFLARFLFALPNGEPDWNARPELAMDSDKAEEERLTEHLRAVYDHYHNTGGVTFLALGDGVLGRYGDYTQGAFRRAYEHDYRDLLLPFAGRLCDYLLKLAMLVQVARGLDERGQFTPPTLVDALSLLRAIRYVEQYTTNVLRLIEGREQVVSGALMQKVFRIIARFGPAGVTHRKALPLANMKADIFRQTIEKLAEVGAIEVRSIKTPGKRRAAKHYTATTDRLPIRKW